MIFEFLRKTPRETACPMCRELLAMNRELHDRLMSVYVPASLQQVAGIRLEEKALDEHGRAGTVTERIAETEPPELPGTQVGRGDGMPE